MYDYTCSIEGRINDTRGFDVEKNKGVFGILKNKVFEAP